LVVLASKFAWARGRSDELTKLQKQSKNGDFGAELGLRFELTLSWRILQATDPLISLACGNSAKHDRRDRMMSTRIELLALAFLVGSLLQGQSTNPSQGQLTDRTQQLRQQLEEERNENLDEMGKLLAKIPFDLMGLSGIGGIIPTLMNFPAHMDLAESLQERNHLLALSQGLEELVNFFEKSIQNMLPESYNEIVANGLGKFDLVSDVASLYLTFRRDGEISGQQIELIRARDPDTERFLQRIFSLSRATDLEFKQWLSKQGLQTEQQILSRAIESAKSISAKASINLGRAITLVDPDQGIRDLENDAQINPDFVEALRRCRRADDMLASGAGLAAYQAAIACDKYPDGQYIPAIGAPRDPGPGYPIFSSNASGPVVDAGPRSVRKKHKRATTQPTGEGSTQPALPPDNDDCLRPSNPPVYVGGQRMKTLDISCIQAKNQKIQ
jgi:hypothetical protein